MIEIHNDKRLIYWILTVEICWMVYSRHFARFGTDLSFSIVRIVQYDRLGKYYSSRLTFLNMKEIKGLRN